MADLLFNWDDITTTATTGWAATYAMTLNAASAGDVTIGSLGSGSPGTPVIVGWRVAPFNSDWPDGGTETTTFNLATTNSSVDCRVRVVRISGSTILQGGAQTAYQTASSNLTFSPVSPTWTNSEDARTNHYGIEVESYNTATHGSDVSIVVDASSTGNSTTQTTLPADQDIHFTHFRFRNDDGSESTATWEAAEDINITRDSSSNSDVRVRLAVENRNGYAPPGNAQLQYRKNGGSWASLTTSSSNVLVLNITNLTNGDDCTRQLTAPTTFLINNNGVIDTAFLWSGALLYVDASGNTDAEGAETEWSVRLVDADLSDTDTIEFKTDHGTTPTLTKIAKITISKAAGAARRIFLIT